MQRRLLFRPRYLLAAVGTTLKKMARPAISPKFLLHSLTAQSAMVWSFASSADLRILRERALSFRISTKTGSQISAAIAIGRSEAVSLRRAFHAGRTDKPETKQLAVPENAAFGHAKINPFGMLHQPPPAPSAAPACSTGLTRIDVGQGKAALPDMSDADDRQRDRSN
jgi:hypothetical protein